MQTHREFRQHKVTREIVAVELFEGALVGVRSCTRPQEQTRGALPVMEIQTGGDTDWYKKNSESFLTWEPPTLPEELLVDLAAADEAIQVCEDLFEKKRSEAKAAKEALDLAYTHMRELVKMAKDAQTQPTLFTGSR